MIVRSSRLEQQPRRRPLWLASVPRLSAVAVGILCCACAATPRRTPPRASPAPGSAQAQAGSAAAADSVVSGLIAGAPGMNRYAAKEPGETQKLSRPYPGAPPVIPHAVADQQIRRANNSCLDCHVDGEEIADGHTATKIPASHYQGAARTEQALAGMRYNCMQCHVPQAAAAPPDRAVHPQAKPAD